MLDYLKKDSCLKSLGTLHFDGATTSQGTAEMLKRIAIFDWDGTIRRDFTISAWLRHLAKAGLLPGSSVSKLNTEFAMYRNHVLSHDELAQRTAYVYASYLAGISESDIGKEICPFITLDLGYLFPVSLNLISHLQKKNLSIAVISGAPIEILMQYQQILALDQVYGLRLETKSGSYTGNVTMNPGISAIKAKTVQELSYSAECDIALAVGNSSSDNPLFRAARVNIVVNNPHLQTERPVLHITPSTSIDRIVDFLSKEGVYHG